LNIPSEGRNGSQSEEVFNIERRTRKAYKIRAMANDFIGHNLSGMDCLDIGCSIGVISSTLADSSRSVIGMDIDVESVQWAHKNSARSNCSFIIANGMQASFSAEIFDVIICAQCYEHVADARQLRDEIYRLLKPGGICIFSGPNRLALIEDHYGLPLLSWLPHPLADLYIQLARRGQAYDINPLTLWELRNLWKNLTIHDYTITMLREPEKYLIEDEINGLAWLRYLPDWLLRKLLIFSPNYNWILQKQNRDRVPYLKA
jgi:SAM-dependent methyltransferase